MFRINDDNSIYVTRGDMVYLRVTAQNNGEAYTFQPGEVLRIKIYGKKDCENVVLQKDFPVGVVTQEVDIVLEERDTKIGGVINKPTDYWYEVELNPFDNPQTIIGYDEDGAKLFRLYPEGGDSKDDGIALIDDDGAVVSGIDDELDMTSRRPVQNQVIARAIAELEEGCRATQEAVTALHVTPQMFGAVGDGKTDDTEAIQKAIDSGRDVRIPSGRYNVRGNIIIDADNVRIAGEGAVLLMNGKNIVVGASNTRIAINNFSIIGVELAYGSLQIKNTNNFTVENCYMHNSTYGLVGSHCYNGNIENSKFSDCSVGVLFDKDILAPNATADHNAISVHNCKFYNNTDAAFIIRGGSVGEFSMNAVEGNNRGIVVEGVADFRIMSNYFEYNKSDIITLNNYGSVLNSSITIGGNRIFGTEDSATKGMVLNGTIIGLLLQPNSWGGLAVLIENNAVLSGPVLLYQVNNTTKQFPDFINNMRNIHPWLIINPVSTAPGIVTGRMFTLDNAVHAHTRLGDYVLDYKMGYVPMLNTTPTNGDGLLYMLPDGTLHIKINGVEKTVQLS